MSPKLPAVSGKDTIRALRRAGFFVARIKGSHHILAHQDDPTRTVVVPVHANRPLKPGTLSIIIKQTGLTLEEFLALF
jgi:predicted RNA binding protein YcfA (HicA-like mRNA interferase family)